MLILFTIFVISITLIICLPKKFIKFNFILTSLSLSILAFNFNPIKAFLDNGNYTDLFRFYNVMDNTRSLGWNYISQHNDYSSLFVARIYVYLISLLNNNGFLAAITCFILYSVIFFVIYRFSKKINSNKNTIILVTCLFLLSINFRSGITNIRNPLVFCIFFMILYFDLIESKNKKACFITYILLCFLHQIAILLFGLRLILIFYGKKNNKLINIIILLWGIIYKYLIEFIYKLTSIEYFKALVNKANYYNSVQEIREVPLMIIAILTIIFSMMILIYFNYRCNDIIKSKYNNIFNYFNMLVLLNIGSINNYHMFLRLGTLLIYLDMIFLMIIFGSKYSIISNVSNNYKLIRGDKFIRSMIVWGTYLFSIINMIYYFFSYQYRILCF